MIKILWFSNTAASGLEFLQKDSKTKGTGGWMNSLNNALKDKVDLSIAFHYPYKKNSFEYKNTKYYPIYNGNIYIELIKNRFSVSVPDGKYLNDYLHIIQEVQPDIIHIHGTESDFLSILKYVQIPTVVSIQGNISVLNHKFFAGFNGKYLGRTKKFSLKDFLVGTKTFKKNKHFLSKRALIEKKGMLDIPFIIGRTKWDYRITRILSPKSIYFQGEELLRDSFYKYKWNNVYQGGKLVVFTTNGDNYYKGIETVFYAITLLQNIGVDIEWRIAGINERSLIKSISKSYLGENFPKSGYTLLGSLTEDELTKELLNSHLYVMPSHIENSPNNLCEAMILGMPCIATFAGGTGSIMADGNEGILIQDGDPWALSGAIVELMRDDVKSKLYGQNARNRALVRHNQEFVVGQYLDIYKKILNK